MKDPGAVLADAQRVVKERPAIVVGILVVGMLAYAWSKRNAQSVDGEASAAAASDSYANTPQGSVTLPSGPSAPFSSVGDVDYYPIGGTTPTPTPTVPIVNPGASPCGTPPIDTRAGYQWVCTPAGWKEYPIEPTTPTPPATTPTTPTKAVAVSSNAAIWRVAAGRLKVGWRVPKGHTCAIKPTVSLGVKGYLVLSGTGLHGLIREGDSAWKVS